MKDLFFILLLYSLTIFSCSPINDIDKLNSIKDRITQKYRPDKRVAIFDIEIIPHDAIHIAKGKTNIPLAKKEFFRSINDLGAFVSDSIEILPQKNLKSDTFGIVNLSVCNIRSKPKHSGELGTQAMLGMPLKVWEEKNGWFRIQTPDGYLGWLDKGGFYRTNKTEFDKWKSSKKIIITSDLAFASNINNNERVSDLVQGNLLKLIEEKDGFYYIEFPDKRKGRVNIQDAELFDTWKKSVNFTPDNFIASAKKYIGLPYLWGGTSPKAMDCSGFTKTAALMNGIILSRDASQQVHQGIEIDITNGLNNLQKGDLLFFGRKATENKKERITHVAIYLGNGKILHETGMVKIQSLNKNDNDFAPDRLKTLVRAKRLFGSKDLQKINY